MKSNPQRLVLLVSAFLLLFLVWPEWRRLEAERELHRVESAVRVAAGLPAGTPARSQLLDRAAVSGAQIESAIPGDSRGLIAAGSAQLLARRPNEALALYRRALALGERGEIDLNLGKVLALLGHLHEADAALLRAAWVNHQMLGTLPVPVRRLIRNRLVRLERKLRKGKLVAPPPMPDLASLSGPSNH